MHQRLALQTKGGKGGAGVLVMTATPIPRTLLMTHYGDLDVSRLTEKPAGRKPIVTKSIPVEAIERLIERLRVQLGEGAQVYWVCPLIESSDKSELAAAEERHAHLAQIFGADAVGLLHGAMPDKAKDATMAAFAANRLKILVATTVIEVGVDVPNANIMVIEHAERFGLAQLHQLRGRVGRGTRESFCMLLYKPPLGEAARQRLAMMEETEDGFKIAEKDLELRGGGEVLGARQSGMPEFRIAAVPNFEELLAAARDDARLVLSPGPAPRPRPAAKRCACCSTSSNATRPCACSAPRDVMPAQAVPGRLNLSKSAAAATGSLHNRPHIGWLGNWIPADAGMTSECDEAVRLFRAARRHARAGGHPGHSSRKARSQQVCCRRNGLPSQPTAHRLVGELDSRLRGNDVRMRRGRAPVPRRVGKGRLTCRAACIGAGGRPPLRALATMSLSLACVSGFTMPAEMMILAASSTLIFTGTTLARGTKHTKPDGGIMPVGMNTLIRSSPGISLGDLLGRVPGHEHQRPDALGGKLHQRDFLEALARRRGRHHRLENLLQALIDIAHDRHAPEHQLAGADQRASEQVGGERADQGQADDGKHQAHARESETAGRCPDCRGAGCRASPSCRRC